MIFTPVDLVNAMLGFAQENKAENAVAALPSMTAANSAVWRDGELKMVP
ncbi:hypothetical protein [Arthrobacter sp. AQ5-05]|nr:hypothetical protein [Arthrobacter sp. AQ5-05]